VDEALKISKVLEHLPAHTVVPTGAHCASACASIIFIAGTNRTVEEGGLLGQHSCSVDGRRDQECNDIIAENAVTKGVAHGNIAAFTTYASPDRMIWFTREQADCHGLTYYPYSEESQFDKSLDPCFFKTLKGYYPVAQSAWRVDFKADGYTAFLRPASDHLRELELNVFCNEEVPGVLFLAMDVAGPSVLISEAIKSASLVADPIRHNDIAYSVSQISTDYSRVTVQIKEDEVVAFLTKSDALSFLLNLKPPYEDIRASTFLANSRKALLFVANHCMNARTQHAKAHD